MATLRQIINLLPVGKANVIKVPAFETAIGNRTAGTNNDRTRREIKAAIMNDKIPIGSNPQGGYWLIDSDAECQEVVDRINATVADFIAKRDAIIRGWQRRKASKQSGNPWPK